MERQNRQKESLASVESCCASPPADTLQVAGQALYASMWCAQPRRCSSLLPLGLLLLPVVLVCASSRQLQSDGTTKTAETWTLEPHPLSECIGGSRTEDTLFAVCVPHVLVFLLATATAIAFVFVLARIWLRQVPPRCRMGKWEPRTILMTLGRVRPL